MQYIIIGVVGLVVVLGIGILLSRWDMNRGHVKAEDSVKEQPAAKKKK